MVMIRLGVPDHGIQRVRFSVPQTQLPLQLSSFTFTQSLLHSRPSSSILTIRIAPSMQ